MSTTAPNEANEPNESHGPATPDGSPAPSGGRRTGRRPGDSRSREAILDAAHAQFLANGYDGATIRGIAAEAAVDPALVYYFFNGKDELFAATMAYPLAPKELINEVLHGGPLDSLGERMVRFMAGWSTDGPESHPVVGVLRSAFAHPNGPRMVREFLTRELFSQITARLTGPDPRLRVTLAGSQLIGMVVARYVVRVEPIASADTEFLVACYAPTVQRYLTGELPDPGGLTPPASP